MKPKVSIYTPSHNYGCYLAQAIDSVVDQTLSNWELIIILDGPTDNSEEIAQKYAYEHPDRIRIFKNETAKGLQFCANLAIRESRGSYVMRLDADDYLDENALLVMASYLDENPEVALVYPNYIYVNESGDVLGVDHRKKIGREVKILDLPAHGACTLTRKRVLRTIGGYDENVTAQDGYDLWLRVARRFPVANVTTPLFYYRQHSKSLTRNEERILTAQRNIKRRHAQSHSVSSENDVRPNILAVIGAKNAYNEMPGIALRNIGGKPLIDHTIRAALDSEIFQRVLVTTDDHEVIGHCEAFEGIDCVMRDEALIGNHVILDEVVYHAVLHAETSLGFYPDIVVFLNCNAPLKTPDQIQTAVDTLQLYNTDSVVSVYEDFDLHYSHGENGLEPLSRRRHRQLRVEREALYVDNRAIKAFWRDALTESSMEGSSVGHFVMSLSESLHIRSAQDIELMEFLLSKRASEPATADQS